MAWESEPIIEMAPDVVEQVLGGDSGRPDPALGEGQVLGHRRVQVVADHQHVEVLVDGVDRVRTGRVGRRRQEVARAATLDDVRGVASAGALGVVAWIARPAMAARVDSTKPASFKVSVWMRRLQRRLVANPQAGVDGRRRGAPVLVQLEPARAAPHLFPHALFGDRVALAQ